MPSTQPRRTSAGLSDNERGRDEPDATEKRVLKMSLPPKLKISQWADQERKLSPEASAEPGQWQTDRAPYQRGIMDAVNDPSIETIVVMSGAQIGKTEMLLNVRGYYIAHDPSPILILQPTLHGAGLRKTVWRQC